MAKRMAVYGICETREQAEATVARLKGAGFNDEDISVLYPDVDSPEKFAHEKHTKAPEGATAGATLGGTLGGVLGLMVATGAPIMIPGLGMLIAAGPIATALAGMGAGGATGGFIGALIGAGIPEYEAKRYENTLRGGGILLSAHCSTQKEVKVAESILKASGAGDVSAKRESGTEMWPPPIM